jgi:hypothetical protein
MKIGSAVIGIIVAGALGYLLEPSIRPALMASANRSANKGSQGGGAPAVPAPAPPAAPEAPSVSAAPEWVAALTSEQMPEKVKLKVRVELPVPGSAEPMSLPAGVEVTPLRIDGGNLVITPFGGPIEGKVAVMSTDLVERLGNKPPAAPAAPVVAAVEPEPVVPSIPEPVQPEPPTPSEGRELSAEEIVEAMQASVKAGEIKEFSFDQVLSWAADEEKESGGETYQSGLASYKAETIFGVKNIQAQALIKDGKVEKWIWPKSGMEIK